MDADHDVADVCQLALLAGDGNHDFGDNLLAVVNQLGGGLEDGADLVLGHLGIGHGKTHAAVPHHRVVLRQSTNALLDLTVADA